MHVHVAGLHLRPRLLARGLTSAEIQRDRRNGLLVNVRRGAYVEPADERLLQPDRRHRLLVSSTIPRVAGGSVVSHVSAAIMHGLPVWGMPLDRVHITRNDPTGGRISTVTHRHTAPLPAADMTVIDGVPVTSVARTVADIARTAPFEQAVVIADAALQTHAVDVADLDAALLRAARWPGIPQARRVVRFAQPGSGSVGESRSRVALAAFGLPAPILQWKVVADGRVIAEVDFGWPALRTVAEFDGRIKYGRGLRPGQSAGDAVFAEKLREDQVRATDLGFVRWTWQDLDHFDPVAQRLLRSFRSR